MKVLKAQAMGMCFGVKDAIERVMALPQPEETAVYGHLVHNEEVLAQLRERGLTQLEEENRYAPVSKSWLVVTAHGLSDREKKSLLDRGKGLIDTTCPLVRRVHETAKHFAQCGYFVVVVGRRDHVEVKGLVGDLPHYAVVGGPEEVRCWEADRIAVICQTTTPPALLEKVFEKIARKNFGKDLRFLDTICRPTRERQRAVEELLDEVEALVVVGGKNSNNTRQLKALAESRRVPSLQVETAAELAPDWFKGFNVVGLTAGTSTLDETIEEVYRALLNLEAAVSHG
jgi:4-hydroxy-3-methylbut-2-en-1-yl diphosphate reductase